MKKTDKYIKIKETRKCDTRTCDPNNPPTKEELLQESKDHIQAVSDCMNFFAALLSLAGKFHDHTKIDYIDEFDSNFSAVAQDNKIEFKQLGWWKKHLTERHHLNDRVPDDVNLVDVFEMVCDCVCAGLARTGEFKPIEISYEILDRAVRNTAKFLEDSIKVVEPTKETK